MKQQRFIHYYFSVAILFIILEYLHTFIPALTVKALLMPMLILFYHSQIRNKYNLLHKLVMTGLGFSWIGDITLHLANEKHGFVIAADNLFVIGLGAFLIAQVFYIVAFNNPGGKHTVLTSHIYLTFFVLVYGFVLIWFLYPGLGDMKIPVILYATVILLMLLSALNRNGKVNRISYILVLTGAFTFVISDTLIAINKFIIEFNFARTIIMATYVSAQYLIVIGCIRQDKIPVKNSENANKL